MTTCADLHAERPARLSRRNMPRLFRPTQPRPHLGAPSLWPPVASRQAPFGPSGTPRSPARVPRLFPAVLTTMEVLTSRCASTQPFGLCLIARSTPPALRPPPGGMNTFSEDATRSPQVSRLSVPPCRPHTPCLTARSADTPPTRSTPARGADFTSAAWMAREPAQIREAGATYRRQGGNPRWRQTHDLSSRAPIFRALVGRLRWPRGDVVRREGMPIDTPRQDSADR
jgi:hypothetical protein